MIVIDASNSVLGRLCSATAKKLLLGEEVVIVNAEHALVTGSANTTTREFLRIRQIGSPQHGPFYPKTPERIVKRTVRGMLPKTKKGVAALKRLKVHAGNPDGQKAEQVAVKQVKTGYITIGKLAQNLGWQK